MGTRAAHVDHGLPGYRARTRRVEPLIQPTSLSCHSITSSVRASSDGGMVRPSAFAVLRFITNLHLRLFWMGRSADFCTRRTFTIPAC